MPSGAKKRKAAKRKKESGMGSSRENEERGGKERYDHDDQPSDNLIPCSSPNLLPPGYHQQQEKDGPCNGHGHNELIDTVEKSEGECGMETEKAAMDEPEPVEVKEEVKEEVEAVESTPDVTMEAREEKVDEEVVVPPEVEEGVAIEGVEEDPLPVSADVVSSVVEEVSALVVEPTSCEAETKVEQVVDSVQVVQEQLLTREIGVEDPEVIVRDALVARRTSLWNCCGLLDVFMGSNR